MLKLLIKTTNKKDDYPYLNPNERKVNQQIKSCVCANRFYEDIQDQKAAVSYFLDNRFGRWNNDRHYDT